MLLRAPLPASRCRLVGEFLGTAFLVIAVVGSGIAAERLTTEPGLRLLINAFATSGALLALITSFAVISGARFNPAATLLALSSGSVGSAEAVGEVVAQVVGGVVGVMVANTMFGLSAVVVSANDRSAGRLVFSEAVATIGLLVLVDLAARRSAPVVVAGVVAGYIAGAYFFTSSTSFANPAVTVARVLTDSYTGIAPGSAVRFLAAQLVGTALAAGIAGLTVDSGERES